MRLKKGFVQVYTGNGKGKTTAAIGLAVRAAGAGLKVFVGQFIKGGAYSELKVIKEHPLIEVRQYGRGCFIKKTPCKKDIKAAGKGLAHVLEILNSKQFDVVILDEINVAMSLGLVKKTSIIDAIKNKPYNVELVLTGRGCPKSIIRRADLATRMKEVKHYYKKGVRARNGIEM